MIVGLSMWIDCIVAVVVLGMLCSLRLRKIGRLSLVILWML